MHMKTKLLKYVLCCLCCSCSEIQHDCINSELVEKRPYEVVRDVNLQHELLSYLNVAVITRASSVVTAPEENYDLSVQEIYCPQSQTSNEEMVVVRNKNNNNNVMAFYKENGVISNCLIIEECKQDFMTSSNETVFLCRDGDNTPIFKAKINEVDHTCNVVEIYSGINKVQSSGRNWGCNLSLGVCGALWSTAFGMVTVGAGFVVGIAWCVFQTWICSTSTTVSTATTATTATTTPDSTTSATATSSSEVVALTNGTIVLN